ncbi:class I SAM-dependent methyltransferase family protein [Methanobrevibacter millerae]|uniref:tRNA(Phe) (4-demethylwyosine(37)-C(7)) aminocarboxypropyltransferase n=1 Tax=Methanobrevibacter millerae TaxID=230361 RepID=A0A0U3CMW3_9EURY|nr:class I SAM-dependent methyltransferase family protein [Methanobrevibacter millerae]ALT69804.1 Met-10 like-protein [Methanobrevibacter millerae]MBO6110698.1 class I SAM-dependent methyltransferase family protein [Methanobrevibacter sp.]MBO6274308.1 class I SAM-dependent methyltransferase family protein [Methanobrevibacter sp.]MBP3226004.1 class I SAM-dependent methyltransferase family protein [Methanobrevibacter sp.]
MKYKKIGDILILNDDSDNLEELAEKHNVKTIMKIDHIQGTKREPVYKILFGSETETINKENKCLFKLDLSKVMWSKGNVNERLRIAKLVRDNETVLDMFAGIGYFSIPIGVHSNARKVISIEINPNSYYYLCENVKLNKCDNITPVLGDCLVETPKYNADRILMGYVKTTHHYLKVAVNSLNKGGIIHYHETVPEKLLETRPISRIKQAAGDRDVELLKINKIKKYAPGVEHVVIDALID